MSLCSITQDGRQHRTVILNFSSSARLFRSLPITRFRVDAPRTRTRRIADHKRETEDSPATDRKGSPLATLSSLFFSSFSSQGDANAFTARRKELSHEGESPSGSQMSSRSKTKAGRIFIARWQSATPSPASGCRPLPPAAASSLPPPPPPTGREVSTAR
jgi:hypothetical protein